MRHPGEVDIAAVMSGGVEVACQRDARNSLGSLGAASKRVHGKLETVHSMYRVSVREAVHVAAFELAAPLVGETCSVRCPRVDVRQRRWGGIRTAG